MPSPAPSLVTRRLTIAMSVTAAAFMLSGCGSDPVSATAQPDPDPITTASTPAPPPENTAPATADVGEFCERAEPLMVPVDRAFIGSDEHVQLWDFVAEVAPADLQEAIEIMGDHYEFEVDPAVPDSQDFPNFPPHIQDTALALSEDIQDRCSAAD